MSITIQGEIRDHLERGLVWRWSFEQTIGAGVTRIIGFVTGNFPVFLEQRDIASTGEDTLVLVYEDVAYTGGTPITLQNRKRAAQNRTDLHPMADIKDDVTATPAGTPITGAHLLFANKGVGSFGSDPEAATIELKKNTSHIVTIKNNDANAAVIGLSAIFRREEFTA